MNHKKKYKTVVITGGGSGIGFSVAKFLIAAGYRVVLLGRSKKKLENALKSLDASSEVANFLVCDLRNKDHIQKAVQKITSIYKNVYALVNNAGIYSLGGLFETSESTWDEAMSINLKGSFLLSQCLAPMMVKNSDGGRIVNISSTAGVLPNHLALAYSVSKAALIQLSLTMAKELGKENITVNCICPGVIRTSLHEFYHSSKSELEEFYAKRGSTIPLGRVGNPEEVAACVGYFLSEQASWITGNVFVIDGGRLLL
jgi:NAD(P)-dependent dehydrogenase (short-subunit alcohol dehydrogenase family)